MTAQLALQFTFPPGHCERIKWRPELWPSKVKDAKGREWSVLHVGGQPTNQQPAQFLCHKPKTVEYHAIKDTEAYPS